jgi:hypothetical protein
VQGQRAFTVVAGLLFASLVVVHVLRILFEGAGPLYNPFFVGITLFALGLAAWSAILLFRRSP